MILNSQKPTSLFRLKGVISHDSSLLRGSFRSPLAQEAVKDYDSLVSDAL